MHFLIDTNNLKNLQSSTIFMVFFWECLKLNLWQQIIIFNAEFILLPLKVKLFTKKDITKGVPLLFLALVVLK